MDNNYGEQIEALEDKIAELTSKLTAASIALKGYATAEYGSVYTDASLQLTAKLALKVIYNE